MSNLFYLDDYKSESLKEIESDLMKLQSEAQELIRELEPYIEQYRSIDEEELTDEEYIEKHMYYDDGSPPLLLDEDYEDSYEPLDFDSDEEDERERRRREDEEEERKYRDEFSQLAVLSIVTSLIEDKRNFG